MFNRQEKKNSRVYFAHFQLQTAEGKKGYATTAVVRRDDLIYYGVAFCAPNDQFCREQGRLRSMKRLFEKYSVRPDEKERNTFDLCEEIVMFEIDKTFTNLNNNEGAPWIRNSEKITISTRARGRSKRKYGERASVVMEK